MAALVSDKDIQVSGMHNRYFAVRHGQVVVRSHNFMFRYIELLIAERVKRTENNSFKSRHWFAVLWIN